MQLIQNDFTGTAPANISGDLEGLFNFTLQESEDL